VIVHDGNAEVPVEEARGLDRCGGGQSIFRWSDHPTRTQADARSEEELVWQR
jgi:hypothetical protein